jgi:hypothetical protein
MEVRLSVLRAELRKLKKIQWPHRDSNPRPPACSILHQRTTLPNTFTCPSQIHVLYSPQHLTLKPPQSKIRNLNWMKIYVVVLQVMIPRSMVDYYQHFEGKICFHLRSRNIWMRMWTIYISNASQNQERGIGVAANTLGVRIIKISYIRV